MKRDIPTDAAGAYKALIDSFVAMTPTPADKLISTLGVFTKQANEEAQKFNAFVQSLSSEQRSVLVNICTAERMHAIHGVLEQMMWWIHCAGLELNYRGVPMPVLRSEGLNGDYIGRVNGWQWPDFSTAPGMDRRFGE